MRPHIVEVETDSLGESLADGDLQGVVVGDGVEASIASADALKLWIWQFGGRVVGTEFGFRDLIQIEGEGQVVAVAGNVGNLRHHVGTYLSLNGDVPLHALAQRGVVLVVVHTLSVQCGRVRGGQNVGRLEPLPERITTGVTPLV